MLLVVAERDQGVTCHLRLGAVPYILIYQRRHRDRDPLVAWPAQYDATGVMTFIVNQDGVVHEKDLGPGTDAAARKMTAYNPDKSWRPVQ